MLGRVPWELCVGVSLDPVPSTGSVPGRGDPSQMGGLRGMDGHPMPGEGRVGVLSWWLMCALRARVWWMGPRGMGEVGGRSIDDLGQWKYGHVCDRREG